MSDSTGNPGSVKSSTEHSTASPSRSAGVLDYARDSASSVRRWFTRTFTADNISSTVKTLLWVTPLTILIWIYAEREQTAKTPDVTIPIAVRSADPFRIVRLQRDSSVRAELVGPRAQVEKVIDMISRPGDSPVVQIEVDRGYKPGKEGWLDVARAVSDHGLFKSMGVSVRDCTPSQLPIFVDELAEREVEVQVPTNVTNLAGPPVFEPKVVKVRGPRSVLDDRNREPLRVTADLSQRQELRTPGAHEIASVPLVASIEDTSISIHPATVKATLDVNESDVPLTINAMTVHTTAPGRLLQDYRVEYDDTLPNVTVIGPPDKIEMLRNDKFEPRPKARLELTSEDVSKSWQERKLHYDLPPNVRVSKQDESRTIRFRLVKQGTGE